MYCKYCGNRIPDDMKTCTKCGNVAASNAEAQPVSQETLKKSSKKAVSIFCCVMIFVLSLGLLSSVALRQSTSEKRIKGMAEKLDLNGIENVVTKNSVGFIAELDGEKINRIYHETSVKEYVSYLAVEYADYMRGGKQPAGPKRDKIAEVFFDNWEEIEEIIGRKITTLELMEIKTHFDKQTEGIGFDEVFAQGFIDGMRVFTSVYMILALAMLLAMFVFLLAKTRGYRQDALLWTSVPLITTSAVVGIAVAMKSVIESVITGNGGKDFRGIISACVDNVSEMALIDGGFVLLSGVLLIGVYILKKLKRC